MARKQMAELTQPWHGPGGVLVANPGQRFEPGDVEAGVPYRLVEVDVPDPAPAPEPPAPEPPAPRSRSARAQAAAAEAKAVQPT